MQPEVEAIREAVREAGFHAIDYPLNTERCDPVVTLFASHRSSRGYGGNSFRMDFERGWVLYEWSGAAYRVPRETNVLAMVHELFHRQPPGAIVIRPEDQDRFGLRLIRR